MNLVIRIDLLKVIWEITSNYEKLLDKFSFIIIILMQKFENVKGETSTIVIIGRRRQLPNLEERR